MLAGTPVNNIEIDNDEIIQVIETERLFKNIIMNNFKINPGEEKGLPEEAVEMTKEWFKRKRIPRVKSKKDFIKVLLVLVSLKAKRLNFQKFLRELKTKLSQ